MTTVAQRNNNPGNLKPPGGAIIWPGQTGTDSRGFAIFSSYDAGVNAADANLQTYAKRGWDTPYEIAHNWSTTDQSAYTNNLAASLGVGPNTPLNLSDPAIRSKVLNDIFHQEDSSVPQGGGTLSGIWNDITAAANNGTPLTFPWSIPGIIANGAAGPLQDAAGAIAGAGNAVGDKVDNWLSDILSSGLKNYVIPVALGAGAIILIMVSAWGLVKDTPAGEAASSVVKTGAKLAVVAA